MEHHLHQQQQQQFLQETRREFLIKWTIYNGKLKRFIKTTFKKSSATKEHRFLL